MKNMATTRVVICWTGISGYMGACWRELSGRAGLDVSVIAFGPGTNDPAAPFSSEAIRGVQCELLSPEQRDDADHVASMVIARKPDVVVLCGWAVKSYVGLADDPALAGCKFILTLDTPWKGNLRQRIGKRWMRGFLQRMDAAMVAGERSAKLAELLGFPPEWIGRGMYAIDFDEMGTAVEMRTANGAVWSRKFLYVGRYAAEKGIDRLIGAYRAYRATIAESGGSPWPLVCCGKGEMAGLLRGIEGLSDIGFVQPADLPRVMAEHGVLILPSRYEPWGAALVEGCAAGLPVIATAECGASLDVVRSFHNGLLTSAEDEAGLTRAMTWMHEHVDRLPEMGVRSRELAAAFSAERWADRWQDLIERLAK
jgi:glycosyltransferase involved in cell wall biosynthesis